MNELATVETTPTAPAPVVLLEPVVTPTQLIDAHKKVAALIRDGLENGRDYGIIKGTKKETLLKPGAERLVMAFGCTASYAIVDQEVDHDRENVYMGWENGRRMERTSYGLYRFATRCIITDRNGLPRGEGIGSCSSLEAKYISRPRDTENTILKMAQKRALVAAVLNAFGLSDRFTQDMEDIAPIPGAEQAPTFNKNDKRHLEAINKLLDKKGVGVLHYPLIQDRMHGRPSSDLDEVIKGVVE